ncbi:DUF1127 domain-containing protein [Aurantimonas sp. DM33-3]|nr:DUF1127 domain-containing protein [Aurantimonas sp. DM33-3]
MTNDQKIQVIDLGPSNAAATNTSTRFARWRATLHRQRELRRMINELSQLDDRTLADIGLCRSDIPRAVKGFEGKNRYDKQK